MPKLKTKKAASRRFRVTGSGKVIRRGRGIKHLLEHLTASVKRRRQQDRMLSTADYKRAKRMMPVG